MQMVRLGAGAALSFLLVGAGCSSSEPPRGEETATTSQAVQGGVTDTTSAFAVGVCRHGNNSAPGNCIGICSGTLIAPNLVATARHCTDQSPARIDCRENICKNRDGVEVPCTFGNRSGGRFSITTHGQMTGQSNIGWHSVKEVIVPSSNGVCGQDIALLVLNDLVSAAEAVPAIPGVQHWMDDGRYSRYYAAIGYGSTGPNGGGSGTRRRKDRVPVLCIPDGYVLACPEAAQIHLKEFVGGDGICSGDSGSGAFEWFSFTGTGAVPLSFGVLGRGGEDGDNCVGAIYTRFDQWRDWVVQGVEHASNNWSLYPKPDPDWTEFVPRPPNPNSPTPKPEPAPVPTKDFGQTCAESGECTSGLCAESDDGKVCSQVCEVDDTCPIGFDCYDNLCLVAVEPPAPAAATTTTITRSGCSVPPDPTQPIPWRTGAVALAAVALALGRRRR
jgi:MYXO-CTERM domain-containing protein